MNYKDEFLEVIKKYTKKDIIFTDHVWKQAIFRSIELEEIKDNIINPKRLIFVRKQIAERKGESKYDCYFPYSNNLCHRYVIVCDGKCIVCTVIKIRRRWQRIMEKHAKL